MIYAPSDAKAVTGAFADGEKALKGVFGRKNH